MKILIDTNIVLDLLLEPEPFIENAIALFENGKFHLDRSPDLCPLMDHQRSIH